MEHQDNPNLPIWRSFGRPSRIEVNPNHEEDELVLHYRLNNRDNIPVIRLADDLEVMAEIESNGKMLRKCLIGVLQDARCFSRDYLQAMLEKVWNIKQGRFFVQGHYENTLLITFEDREERDLVLERSPWDVNGGLLMLIPWKENVAFTTFRIEKCPVWVQIQGLPKDFHSARWVAILGAVAGEVHLIDWPENSSYMRVRTIIKSDEALVAGVYLLNQDGKWKHWVEFRYEGVCVLCHRCGVIGHVKKDCTVSTADMNLRARSKLRELQTKLCKELSALKGLSFLVKFHSGCELQIKGIPLTNQQATRPAEKHCHNPNAGQSIGSKQIHDNKQDNHGPSYQVKDGMVPKKKIRIEAHSWSAFNEGDL